MITYIRVDDNRWIEYDDATDHTRLVRRADLRDQKQQLVARIAALPVINNAFKIAWFDQHYPEIDVIREREALQAELTAVRAILNSTGGE